MKGLDWQKHRAVILILASMVVVFLLAIQGMSTQEWVITLLRGLAVGSITFLVAAGFSLIFGLMDVLNLAHGTMFMIGAYVGWTVLVRPDTFIDTATPAGLVAAGLVLVPFWTYLMRSRNLHRGWSWAGFIVGLALVIWGVANYPITSWDPGDYAESPVTYAFNASQGNRVLPPPELFTTNPYLVLVVLLAGTLSLGWSLAMFSARGLRGEKSASAGLAQSAARMPRGTLAIAGTLFSLGLAAFFFHGALTDALAGLGSTWLFLLAILVAVAVGFGLGALMESSLIRPLYARPIYQILMTLGVSAIGIEVVRAVWGRPEFTMPKPAIFNGSGERCPATSLGDLLAGQCSTIELLGGRVRTYNEVFVPLLGIAILIAIWLLLQRTRLGMIIRAGVQDSVMVEALGINVRRVFTLVFALGVALAALGGVVAGPSMGISLAMGESLLINALIALAIGGLTSFPGAAAGSLLVGLIQQFIIKYGQIGIHIPFLAEPFKPTPPLVPASTVLLMVIVLLVLPNGLFGRRD